jgi:hypothetical protein
LFLGAVVVVEYCYAWALGGVYGGFAVGFGAEELGFIGLFPNSFYPLYSVEVFVV